MLNVMMHLRHNSIRWISVIAFLGAIVYVGMSWKKVPESVAVDRVSHSEESTTPSAQSIQSMTLGAKNFFNVKSERNEAPASGFPEFPPSADETKPLARIIVMGTFVSARNSAVILKDLTGDSVLLLQEGQRIKSSRERIARIDAQGIVLSSRFGRRRIAVGENSADVELAQSPSVGNAPNPTTPVTAQEASESTDASVDALASVSTSASKLFGSTDAEPAMRGGQMVGVRVGSPDANSIIAAAGVAKGDVITSINDIQLDSMSTAYRILDRLSGAKQIEINVERNGSTMPLFYFGGF